MTVTESQNPWLPGIKNAVIGGYTLGLERGFAVTLRLQLDYGGSGQAFGGQILYNASTRKGGDFAGQFIAQVLKVVGVNEISEVVGKTIRVDGDSHKIHRIGHIVKDLWLSPGDDINWNS